MNATTNEVRMAGLAREGKASTDSTRYAENAMLTELPGIAFGLLTLVYIVSSLLALA
jgi:hypothetical protein